MATTAKSKPRRYQDFLTPAWHRKFTAAAILAFGACYVDALAMADWSSVWFWFPLSITGLVSLLLFISVLPVFVIRVAATHVGSRTIASPLESFRANAFTFTNISIFVWYIFSAWWYSEIYRWTGNAEARLGWVEHATTRDKPGYRLNERAIAFITIFVFNAIGQSLWHIFLDVDKAPFPISLTTQPASTESTDDKSAVEATTTTAVATPFSQVKAKMPDLALKAAQKTLITFVISVIVYYMALRRPLWNISYSFFSNFYDIRSRGQPRGIVPAAPFIGRTLMQSFLLFLTWDFANMVYNAHVSQEPLKHGKPLTDASKDPNGTLLIGLGSKRPFAQASAFWELSIVTARFSPRRITIFSELERSTGPMWSSVLVLCLGEVSKIKARIDATKQQPPAPQADTVAQNQIPESNLPPLKTDNIMAKKSAAGSRAVRMASDMAKAVGQYPGDAQTPLKKVAAAGEWTAQQAGKQLKNLPYAAEAENRAAHLMHTGHQSQGAMYSIIRAPIIGQLFQTTFAKQATAVICGGPYSRTTIIVCAIASLTNLARFSLKEDQFGSVSKDVPKILETFTSVLREINEYMASLKPDWTDVTFTEKEREKVEEVNAVRDALKLGLRDLLGSFGEFTSGMGVSEKDVRAAKALAGVQEMKSVNKLAAR